MEDCIWVVQTTLASAERAHELAAAAVQERLAACCQAGPEVVSHYVWEGQSTVAREIRLSFKVKDSGRQALVAWLRRRHPYTVPEILCWKAACGDPAYREWVENA